MIQPRIMDYLHTASLALVMILLSCAGPEQFLSDEDCARLGSVPDKYVVDTLGILGTIFPRDYVYPVSDSALSGPYSNWTPTMTEVLQAEEILLRHAGTNQRCIAENYYKFYRQYAGRGQYQNSVLIHGIRMSKQTIICGKKSFWINIYRTGCGIFDAYVDIRLGTCDVQLYEEE